jgi:hypothetical protein
MTKDEIQSIRESAVFAFLTENEGAVLVSEQFNSAIIRTGGMTSSQLRFHLIAIAATLGGWFPLFLILRILRMPRSVLVHVHANGRIERINL